MEKFLQRITDIKTWDDLSVSKATLDRLQEIRTQFRSGRGARALFTGPTGTGKTLAAKVLAAELDLDLYRVNLSSVVSKYIGETEKNLSAMFEHSQRMDIVLLFDEADALFGKRTDVEDSHDRYANLETDYLLQKIENYPGLIILTSNLRTAFDDAFIQRMTWDVDFISAKPEPQLPWWRRVLIWFGLK